MSLANVTYMYTRKGTKTEINITQTCGTLPKVVNSNRINLTFEVFDLRFFINFSR